MARPEERKFLGFSFTGGLRPNGAWHPRRERRFKERIRELTLRRRGVSLEEMVQDLTSYLRGCRGYFGFCQTPWTLIHLDAWIRRRLRAGLWTQWKHVGRRRTELEKRGVSREWAKKTPAAYAVPGGSATSLPSGKPCPIASLTRSVCPASVLIPRSIHRTDVYGPVCTVVWQGSAGSRRPYAESRSRIMVSLAALYQSR